MTFCNQMLFIDRNDSIMMKNEVICKWQQDPQEVLKVIIRTDLWKIIYRLNSKRIKVRNWSFTIETFYFVLSCTLWERHDEQFVGEMKIENEFFVSQNSLITRVVDDDNDDSVSKNIKIEKRVVFLEDFLFNNFQSFKIWEHFLKQ